MGVEVNGGKAERTRLTKTGQPVMGTPIEVRLDDGTWERCTVVGKGFGVGRYAHTMVLGIVEWGDGTRQPLHNWPDLNWRALQGQRESTTSEGGERGS